MNDQTRGDVGESHLDLEHQAALAIGQFVIEFGRLEMELGLAVAWGGGGESMENRSEDLIGASFGLRLKMLKDHIQSLPATLSECAAAYSRWIKAAVALCESRNRLIHGRWAILQNHGVVANVLHPPTSPRQHEVRYRIPELTLEVRRVVDARNELAAIRKKWPFV